MPIRRFQFAPDDTADSDIDSKKISAALQAAGINVHVKVIHHTGVCTISWGQDVKDPEDSSRNTVINTAMGNAMRALIMGRPRFRNELP